MSRIDNLMNGFGEVIHDHQGYYRTISSGRIAESEISLFILKDTEVGKNDNVNQIIDFGFSNGCKYIWSNFCTTKTAKSVAMGRSHATYTECTLDTLKDAEMLLFFPYVDADESQNFLQDVSAFQSETRMRDCFSLAEEKLQQQKNAGTAIPKELIYNMICYSLKQKRTGFRNFLYILVPDSVEDYQAYCRNIIVQFINLIPVGMRKQFRFATNAANDKENNYHILFSRESNLTDPEKIKKSVSVEKCEIPQFLLNHGLDSSTADFIERCVNSVYYQTESNMIEECYEQLEKKLGNLEKIKERDYKDYYEVLLLGEQTLTPDLLRDYSDKLGQDMANVQRELLNLQINYSIENNTCLENVLEQDRNISQANTLELLKNALLSYTELIKYLRKQDIKISKQFCEARINLIQKEFDTNKRPEPQNCSTEELLNIEIEWYNLLNSYSGTLKEYFDFDDIENVISESEIEQEYLKEQFKQESIQSWIESLKESFTEDNLKNVLGRTTKMYPDELESLSDKLYLIMVSLGQREEENDEFLKSCITIIRQYSPSSEVPLELRDVYKRQTEKELLDNPNKQDIEREIAIITEICGEETANIFTNSLRDQLSELLYRTSEETTVFSRSTCTAIWELINCNKLSQTLGTANEKVAEFKDAGNRCMGSLIIVKLETALKYNDQNLSKYFRDVDSYVVGELKKQCKQYMTQVVFDKMKCLADKTETTEEVSEEDKKRLVEGYYQCLEEHNMLANDTQECAIIKEWYTYWCNEKKRQERCEMIKENTKFFEAYFYSCRREANLMEMLDEKELRKQIYAENVRKKKHKKGYTFGAFLAAASYVEEYSIESLLFDTNVSRDINAKKTLSFYMDEFEEFSEIALMPILIKKEDTVSELYHQIECYEQLSSGTGNKIPFICYTKGEKRIEIKTKYKTAKRVLDTLIKIKNNIPFDEEYEGKRIKDSEAELWEFLLECGLVNKKDCEQLILFAEEFKSERVMKAVKKYMSKKNASKITKLVSLCFAFMLLVTAIVLTIIFWPKGENKPSETDSSKQEQTQERDEDSEEKLDISTEKEDKEDLSDETTDEEEKDVSDENADENTESNLSNASQAMVRDKSGISKTINVREQASTSGSILMKVSSEANLVVEVLGAETTTDGKNWMKIRIISDVKASEDITVTTDDKIVKAGTECYIVSDFLDYNFNTNSNDEKKNNN